LAIFRQSCISFPTGTVGTLGDYSRVMSWLCGIGMDAVG
jgi:hypothetical protein